MKKLIAVASVLLLLSLVTYEREWIRYSLYGCECVEVETACVCCEKCPLEKCACGCGWTVVCQGHREWPKIVPSFISNKIDDWRCGPLPAPPLPLPEPAP